MCADTEEPEWLTRFRARDPPEAVAEAWVRGFDADAKREAEADAPTARARLRRAIVNSTCPEVRADAADRWRYTGSVLRAADAVLGIPPPVPRAAGGSVPGSRAALRSGAPTTVVAGDGRPGTLGVVWSDFAGACNAQELRRRGVTRRLNCAVEIVGKLPAGDGIPTTDVAMEDVFDDDAPGVIATWVAQLREIVGAMRGWRAEGGVVNVNCQMGKNRSGAAVAAWLCSECGWELPEAVEHLRGLTALALCNPHLVRAVADFLMVDATVPLHPSGDGGAWVCVSPPGTPRAGGTEAFEDVVRQAAQQLGSAAWQAAASDGGGGQGEGEGSDGGDVAGLFDDLSDVD